MNYDGKVRVHIFDEKNGLKRNSLVMGHDFCNVSTQGKVIKNIFLFLYMTQIPPKNRFLVEQILQKSPHKIDNFSKNPIVIFYQYFQKIKRKRPIQSDQK